MNRSRKDDCVEIAGALTPDLALAAHSSAHPARLKRPEVSTTRKAGESPSVNPNSPSAPKRP